ncbi:TIGR03619 family F420-dependent LLM class oxidoreductase [Rhodoplanes roseus]|uniref:LLM class F420-dependent oxidoreductase n=1 Tax=Rhodoplanes roseus TaxID=29409 RepID=A0A327KZ24_9BRAD|nr:TIGR03619 family F420-dependent LLM class oxidoreductase [Rhodoplanes roseus]RAI44130.1 LLM class F420-dependent oxidoreductase [Rhodoplanes roseus]
MSLLYSVGFPTGMEGLTYPIPFSDPETLVEIAQYSEKLGYHSIWGNDHMTTQHYVRAEFPVPPRFWEPLVTYAFLAAHTTTLRFGTGVLVLPMRRDIVVTAKQIATLDHLSNGRVEIGVGVGAYREEFEALNPDGQVHRGDMVEEGVKALQLLFSERSASFDGKYYKFKDVELYPKTKQAHLPIYFGGNNPNHLRRTAESADGWVPAGLPLETLRRMVQELKGMTEAAGRDFSKLQIAPQYVVHLGKDQESAVARYQQSQMFKHFESLRKSTLKGQAGTKSEDINLVGSVQTVVDRANAFREAGVTHFLGLFFAANSVAELKDQMQMFAEEVRPKIG